MLPGTYIPTEPREIQAFAMEKARTDLDTFSKKVAEYETAYRDLGLRYHMVPLLFREQDVSATISIDTWAAFTIHADVAGINNANTTPDLIDNFTRLREYRDDIQASLYRADPVTAQKHLEFAEPLMDLVEDRVVALDYQVDRLMAEFFDAAPEVETAQLVEGARRRRDWMLALPEVKQALELGAVQNEEDALEILFQGGEERILD